MNTCRWPPARRRSELLFLSTISPFNFMHSCGKYSLDRSGIDRILRITLARWSRSRTRIRNVRSAYSSSSCRSSIETCSIFEPVSAMAGGNLGQRAGFVHDFESRSRPRIRWSIVFFPVYGNPFIGLLAKFAEVSADTVRCTTMPRPAAQIAHDCIAGNRITAPRITDDEVFRARNRDRAN